jgi:hypothetical protein
MARDLEHAGMRVTTDTNALEWAERWGTPPDGRLGQYLKERHLVVAERVDR